MPKLRTQPAARIRTNDVGQLLSLGGLTPRACNVMDLSRTGFLAEVEDGHGFRKSTFIETELHVHANVIKCLAKPTRFLEDGTIGFEIIQIDSKNREVLNELVG